MPMYKHRITPATNNRRAPNIDLISGHHYGNPALNWQWLNVKPKQDLANVVPILGHCDIGPTLNQHRIMFSSIHCHQITQISTWYTAHLNALVSRPWHSDIRCNLIWAKKSIDKMFDHMSSHALLSTGLPGGPYKWEVLPPP